MPRHDPMAEALAEALVSAAFGNQAAAFRRSDEIRNFVESDDNLLPTLDAAVHQLLAVHRSATREGARRSSMIAIQAATAETMGVSATALMNAVLLDHLSRLLIELEGILHSHDRKMGFMAPELAADRQVMTLGLIRHALSEARGQAGE